VLICSLAFYWRFTELELSVLFWYAPLTRAVLVVEAAPLWADGGARGG